MPMQPLDLQSDSPIGMSGCRVLTSLRLERREQIQPTSPHPHIPTSPHQ